MVDKKIYEMVLVINPAQSEQASETLKRYCNLAEEHNAEVIRAENWGRQKLAYAIKNQIKGHYLYVNFIADYSLIEKIENVYLKHNDAVLRSWISKMDERIDQHSPLYKENEDAPERSIDSSHPEYYDFKNVRLLRNCIMETCRILPRRTTGLNAQQQRKLTRSIKVARILSLLPYCDRHPSAI